MYGLSPFLIYLNMVVLEQENGMMKVELENKTTLIRCGR